MAGHGHFHDVACGGPALRPGILHRTGWTMLAGCPRPPGNARFACRVDLRGDAERAVARGGGALAEIPLDLPGAAARLAGSPSREVYRVLYGDLLRDRGHAVAAVLTRLSGFVPRPVVLGCSLGKDRTGLVVAVLSRLLGVPAEETARQERAARTALTACEPAALAYATGRGIPPAEFHRRCGQDASWLPDLVDEVTAGYGGVREYLVAHGMAASAAEKLRGALRA